MVVQKRTADLTRRTRKDGSTMSLAASKRANELDKDLNAWEENRLLTSGVVRLKEVRSAGCACPSDGVSTPACFVCAAGCGQELRLLDCLKTSAAAPVWLAWDCKNGAVFTNVVPHWCCAVAASICCPGQH